MAAELNDSQIRRYARHILLPEVGGVGQLRLLSSTLTVAVGPGCDAAIVALAYLAAAGVGTLRIAGDATGQVTAAEIPGGILFGTADIDRPRIDAIRARIAGINPDVVIALAEPDSGDLASVETRDGAPHEALIQGGAAAVRALHRLLSSKASDTSNTDASKPDCEAHP